MPAEKFATFTRSATNICSSWRPIESPHSTMFWPPAYPRKGRVLTQLSLFWFDFLKGIVPNHLVTADVRKYPPELQQYANQLHGRSMLVVNGGHDRHRVRGARLSFRLGLEGVQGRRFGLRHQAARGIARVGQVAGADFHARHQGQQRPRRKHFV